jgi:steroid delta-isomerase-like uncharacterized protein
MLQRFILVSVVAVFLTALYTPAGAGDNEETNLTLMKRFYSEVVNQGNLALIDELCAANFVEHEDLPVPAAGREGVKKFFEMYRAAFPDLKFKVEMMFAKDDKVVTYTTVTGTQKGPFMDMPASGKAFTTKGIDIVRFKDGMAVEHWGVTDSMTMMQQLGALPEQAAKE